MQDFFTVAQLNEYIAKLLDNDPIIGDFWLKGELSGVKLYQQSGHMYFTIKDKNAAVSCVMFKSRVRKLKFQPEDGIEVLVRGSVSVYARQGKYQVYVEEMQVYGLGGLYLYLEQLKESLKQAGYFAPDKKKDIPYMARSVGVVTSQDGAAIRDILKGLRQRYNGVEVVLVHSAVQGVEAPMELARGIELLNEYGQVDVIIVGRGGGSFEDLMAFNSEEIVKAIYASKIPIISAVGHEVDYSLSDLAADLRAATPTQAAQLAVADFKLLQREIDTNRDRMLKAMDRIVKKCTETLDKTMMNRVWQEPAILLQRREDKLVEINKYLLQTMDKILNENNNKLSMEINKLDNLSPLKVMKRGYSIIQKENKIVNTIDEIQIGDRVEALLADGNVNLQIISREKVERWKK